MNHIHLEKKGLRGLGIAESFHQNDTYSNLAGVVIRRDFIIDGFVFGKCTIEGDDATTSILEMYGKLERDDISFIMISGLIISMYNIIDIQKISEKLGLPTIGVTYEDSKGIEESIKKHFPNSYKEKIDRYRQLEKRTKISLHTGYDVYIRTSGCIISEAKKLLDAFTLQGAVPEPLRVAQLLAKTKT